MNKYFQRMMKIVALILCFTLGVTCVGAKSGESITIDKKHLIYSGVASRSEAKFHTTMGYAWCITPRKTGADQGAVLKFTREEADGGVLYLLDHADTNDSGYILTQLALWMYESDYLYGVLASSCARTTAHGSYSTAACGGSNWLYGNGYEWTITPYSYASDTVWIISNTGYINGYYAYNGRAVRPVLYLGSTVYKIDGDGSKTNPYIIGM